MKDVRALDDQLVDDARRCRTEARRLPPGNARDALLKKARQAEAAANLTAWVESPGLKPPE
jgi:hypothetical protein